MRSFVSILWALPVTCLGALLVVAVLVSGGEVTRRRCVVCCWGGGAGRVLGRRRAVTLGHVVTARDFDSLEGSWRHELEHVRQFERWGVLLLVLACFTNRWEIAAECAGRRL